MTAPTMGLGEVFPIPFSARSIAICINSLSVAIKKAPNTSDVQGLYTSFINKKPYTVEILDTAGEEDYQKMMDMWINFGEGFLLVFAINDKISFDLIPKKRERVLKGKHGQNVPMILVGNKVDLENKRQVPIEEAKKLADSWGIEYIETSAKTNVNCNEAFEKLVVQIASSKVKKTKPCPCSIY